MHFVVMGCGRVGAEVALTLEDSGHSVAVVDKDANAFRRLGNTFSGETVVGIGFDRETLEQAGTRRAYAFAAVSSGDNSNILAARVAREVFDCDNVVARIYDQKRAEVYQRMGIPTVATVRWTADQMLRRMMPAGSTPHFTDTSGRLQLGEVTVHQGWVGRPVADLEAASGTRVAFIVRMGEGILPTRDTLLQQGDTTFVMMHRDAEAKVDATIATAPAQEEQS